MSKLKAMVARQPQARRHHYVPKVLLKRFVDSDKWLHFYDKNQPEIGVRPTRIENAFVQSHIYSEIDDSGAKDPKLESEFSKIEDKIEPILSKALAAIRLDQTPQLCREKQALLREFLILQWKRVPDLRRSVATDEEMRTQRQQVLAELRERFPERAGEIDALSDPTKEALDIRNVRVRSLRDRSPRVVQVLKQRGLAFIRIRVPGKAFIIASRPVAQLAFRDGKTLADAKTEMWLPVASDAALGVGNGIDEVSLYFLDSEQPVRLLNLAMASQSTAFASRSARLTASLASRR